MGGARFYNERVPKACFGSRVQFGVTFSAVWSRCVPRLHCVVALYRPLAIQTESGIASTSEQSKEPLRGAVPQLIDDHSDNDDTADDNVGVRVWDGQLAATTANGGDDEGADHGSENGSPPTIEAASAKHNSGNDFKFFASTVARIAILDVSEVQQTSDCDKKSCKGVNGNDRQGNTDATQTSSRFT